MARGEQKGAQEKPRVLVTRRLIMKSMYRFKIFILLYIAGKVLKLLIALVSRRTQNLKQLNRVVVVLVLPLVLYSIQRKQKLLKIEKSRTQTTLKNELHCNYKTIQKNCMVLPTSSCRDTSRCAFPCGEHEYSKCTCT